MNVYRLLPLIAALLLTAACTAGGKDAVYGAAAKVVDEGCALGALGMAARVDAVREINARTTNGNYTASDCDSDGQPDFDIDANGQPVP